MGVEEWRRCQSDNDKRRGGERERDARVCWKGEEKGGAEQECQGLLVFL